MKLKYQIALAYAGLLQGRMAAGFTHEQAQEYAISVLRKVVGR